MWLKLLKSILACAAGSLAGTVVAVFILMALLELGDLTLAGRLARAAESAVKLGGAFSLLTFTAMAGIGLPVQWLMQKAGRTAYWLHIWPAVIGGALISCFIGAGSYQMAPYGALAGFIAASVFWWIRRPDKDTPRLTEAPAP